LELSPRNRCTPGLAGQAGLQLGRARASSSRPSAAISSRWVQWSRGGSARRAAGRLVVASGGVVLVPAPRPRSGSGQLDRQQI